MNEEKFQQFEKLADLASTEGLSEAYALVKSLSTLYAASVSGSFEESLHLCPSCTQIHYSDKTLSECPTCQWKVERTSEDEQPGFISLEKIALDNSRHYDNVNLGAFLRALRHISLQASNTKKRAA